MREEDNVAAVAKAMIRAFGDRAAAIMRKRAADHLHAGEEEGARFWRGVETAIRRLETEASLPPRSERTGGPARGCELPRR